MVVLGHGFGMAKQKVNSLAKAVLDLFPKSWWFWEKNTWKLIIKN